ncbi:Delta(6)-protoilludene synthase [Psilocybe cubensis]|uniref:Delta(6)-protoilludene synthase n=2 Tax=Psilocybe cubensis TaxID=181762 RepID=A0ACB8GRT1_PSICU|nr:Delta(6)-protoilludene synthase [Psilocybe cubensis]KAH9478062.1 Delta(6)-protoilludene synthase [Psilocybe cubensis]
MSAISNFTVPNAAPSQDTPFYILPDVLRDWPYKRMISPHYRAARAESGKWLESFRPFSPEAQIIFNKCDFGLLSALTIPKASHDVLRGYCDLMNTFFVLDEYTDVASVDDTRLLCEITMDAILNPDKPRHHDEPVIGEISRQFWKNSSAHASPETAQRFLLSWRSYIDSVIEQAAHRDNSRYICTVEEYMVARRDNIGASPCYAFLEMSLNLNIPSHIMQHPVIARLERDTTDMILLLNDLASYKKEYLADDADYNLVTVVMHNNNVGIDDAVKWICDIHDETGNNFLKLRDEVKAKLNFPDYGEDINRQIECYIDGLGNWVRGNEEWMYGSERYFGSQGEEIRESRKVFMTTH